MKLYYSTGACSLAPHIVLHELGLGFEAVKTDIRAKKTENGDDFFVINPKGQVPTLALDDGTILTEGVAITQFLADNNPDKNLAPAAGTVARAKLVAALNFISSEYHKAFSPLFHPTADPAVKEFAKNNVIARLDYIEKELSDGRKFFTGDNYTIADAYLFTVTNWTKFVGIDLANYPNLAAFQGRVGSRPATIAALKAEGLI